MDELAPNQQNTAVWAAQHKTVGHGAIRRTLGMVGELGHLPSKAFPREALATILEMMGKRDAADERAGLAQDALYFAQGAMGIGQMLKNLGHDDNVAAVAFSSLRFTATVSIARRSLA